jgi:hypothetical protein
MEDRRTNRQINNRRFDVERIIRQNENDDRERRINYQIDRFELRARNVRELLMQQTHSRYHIMQVNQRIHLHCPTLPLLRYRSNPNKPAYQGG